jgi:hypothetical protein
VVTWNENAAKAATAACLHASGNGLAESRMYAMVHVAIHDAVNAIDRRSRPYAFDAEATSPASVDAAVAAAARDVLVSVISTLPESAECRTAGIADVNTSYAAALTQIRPQQARSLAANNTLSRLMADSVESGTPWIVDLPSRPWRPLGGRPRALAPYTISAAGARNRALLLVAHPPHAIAAIV